MLTTAQRAALLDALAPFADHIVRVDIFGSRARGSHRPGSDIDLVIVDVGDDDAYARMLAALEESQVSVPIDVVRWRDVSSGPIGESIARDAVPVFSRVGGRLVA